MIDRGREWWKVCGGRDVRLVVPFSSFMGLMCGNEFYCCVHVFSECSMFRCSMSVDEKLYLYIGVTRNIRG